MIFQLKTNGMDSAAAAPGAKRPQPAAHPAPVILSRPLAGLNTKVKP